MPKPVESALEGILGLREIDAVYGKLRALDDERSIAEKLLQRLEVTYGVAERDLDHIPRQGAAVLVVNHPFGILEGAVLATILRRIRPDVKILANGVLAVIPELRDIVIPVDPMGGAEAARGNPSGLRHSLRFLAEGGLLVVFPAGEVSHFQWKERSITDPRWNPAVARILALAVSRAANLVVVPAYVDGANSLLFQIVGLLHPRLRTALLVRELLNKYRTRVSVRIGSAISVEKLLAIPNDEERTQYLRWRTYLLASRRQFKPKTRLPLPRGRNRSELSDAIAPVVDPETMSREIQQLPSSSLLTRSGDLCAFLATADAIPAVLAEIGRLREVTFRAAGEGTGKAIDLDEFDRHYLHLFLWNEANREVVGAYRLAGSDDVRSRYSLRGLYTATLFDYGNEFLDRMGPALELGRSFIRAEYQRTFPPLLLLWKAIGKYVARNPRYKCLFGPVSISNQYQSISRELMVSFLERHASLRDWVGLVSTRNPFRRSHPKASLPSAAFDIEDLSAVVSDIEPSRAGVPVLLRQYLKLGGKLLGVNVDPKFSNALDGLILVDLTKTVPRLLERYLGKAEAAEFLAFQKGQYGTQ